LFKYSSLSSIIGSLSVTIYILITGQINDVIFFAIMFILIFFTHRENIKRLKNKEESKTKIY
jgi:glycerol-3-phosphate acyltransferase PlsY